MYLYHGSKNYFKAFSFEHIGENDVKQTEGYGMHLTTKESIAQEYAGEDGYVYRYELADNIKLQELPKKNSIHLMTAIFKKLSEAMGSDVTKSLIQKLNIIESESKEQWCEAVIFEKAALSLLSTCSDGKEFQIFLCETFDPIPVIETLYKMGYGFNIETPKYGNHTVYTLYSPEIVRLDAIRSVSEEFSDRNKMTD